MNKNRPFIAERLTLPDDGVDDVELRLSKPNLYVRLLVLRIHDVSTGNGTSVILTDDSVRQLMDWLNRNYDAQE